MIKGYLKQEIRRFFEGQADFENLPVSEFNGLLESIKLKKVRKGQWIFDQEDGFENVFFLKEGHVKLFSMNEEGEEGYLSFVTPKSMFPVRGILDSKEYQYNAVALCDVELYYLPAEEMRRTIIHNYTFTISFMKRMEKMVCYSESLLERTTSSSAKQRVKQVLEGLVEEYGQRENGIRKIPFKIFLKDLATLSGTTSETAGTVINQMKKEKKVSYNKKIISFM